MAVRLVYYPTPFDADVRDVTDEPWREGMTVDDLLPGRLQYRDAIAVKINGWDATLQSKVSDGDVVAACPRPGGDPVSVTAYWFGTELFTFSAAEGYLLIGAAAAIYALSKMLMPKPPKRRDDNESPTYGFSGQGNVRGEGQPIPVVYGRLRYAGALINEFQRVRTLPAVTDYYGLFSFGEGPIYAIAGLTSDTARGAALQSGAAGFPTGIQLNGNDASTLSDVIAGVRMGTLQQDLLSDDDLRFEDTSLVAAVGLGLLSRETTAGNNGTLIVDATNYTGATANTHFTSYGASYDFTTDYDAFRAVIEFPGGLFNMSTSGGAGTAYFACAVRYIELDGGGVPIATGGPEGDGYVRLQPEPRITATQRGTLGFEIEHVFYDPQTYTHPSGGRALVLPGTATKASASTPTQWATDVDAFSWGAWVYINTDTVADANMMLFEWTKAGLGNTTKGFSLWIATLTNQLGASERFFALKIGTGTSAVWFHTYNNNVNLTGWPTGSWHYLVCTYKKNYAGGTDDRVRLYVDGSKVFERHDTNYPINYPGSSDFFQVGDAGFDGLVDELELDNREWTSLDIAQRWNAGQGAYMATTSTHVGFWHFDTTSAVSAADSSTRANTLTFAGGANVPSAVNGKVPGSPVGTNTPKRGRYRVEIVRTNEDSTSPGTFDESTWTTIAGLLDQEFSYPTTPMLGLRVRANEQLNTSAPTVTALLHGRLCPVWDGATTSPPLFVDQWTRNPAWVAVDIILNTRYGLGDLYTVDDIDVDAFAELADYADELVYDAQGQFVVTTDWTDMTYTGSAGVGTIVVQFTSSAYARTRWEVGDFLGLTGVPVVSADVNTADPGGWEITALDSAAYTVTIAVDLGGTDPWATGTLLSAHATVAGTIEGRERRYCLDGALDTEQGGSAAVFKVLSTARAAPFKRGKRITVFFDRPRDPVELTGYGSVEPGSFEVDYTGARDKANSLSAEFLDEDRNYDRSSVGLDHPSVQNASSLDQVRRESFYLEGIVRRSQALRHLAYTLNVNASLVRAGRFVTGIEGVALTVGDVIVISHDVTGWGESGRIYATNTASALKIDRDVTLGGGTYSLVVRNSATGLYETRTVSSGAGAYAMGAAISVSSAFTFTPQRDDVYALVLQGEEFLAQIVDVNMTPNLKRKVEWIEYVPSIYTDDWFGDLTGDNAPPASGSGSSPLLMPPDADDVTVEDASLKGAGNTFEPQIHVAWSYPFDETEHIAGASILLCNEAGGTYREVARVDGPTTNAIAKFPMFAAGTSFSVVVQPFTHRGVRRRPRDCPHVTVQAIGVADAPVAPTGLRMKLDGEQAVYTWTPGDAHVNHEVRRGGWILGIPVGKASSGMSSIGPIADWAAFFATAFSSMPKTYVRAMNAAGYWSAYDIVQRSLAPSGLREQPDWITASNTAWETYVDGWRTASSPPAGDPVITGFTVVDDATHGDYLTFDGSSLTATYETAYTAPSFSLTANPVIVRAYVEAWIEAEQNHPLTLADITWGIGDPRFSRWTLEGPLTLLPGESENCTLRVQINYHDGVDWSGWQDVTSGSVYYMTDAKFRLLATRPSTDYDVFIRRFVTRIRIQSETNNERTPLQAMLMKEVFGG